MVKTQKTKMWINYVVPLCCLFLFLGVPNYFFSTSKVMLCQMMGWIQITSLEKCGSGEGLVRH
jgi:hypothetical protein